MVRKMGWLEFQGEWSEVKRKYLTLWETLANSRWIIRCGYGITLSRANFVKSESGRVSVTVS